MTYVEIWRRWRRFWFEPRSPLPVAVFRILFGVLSLQNAANMWPGFLSWYGVNGLIPIDSVIKNNWGGLPRFDLILVLPRSDFWVVALFWAYVLATFFVTIGFCTRYSAAFMALSLISFHHHDVFNCHGGDVLQRLCAIFLTFSHADAVLSVDALLRLRHGAGATPSLYSPWAQRMLQVQVALIYYHSFSSKIVQPDWLNGTAVYYATRIDNLVHLPMTFLFDNLLVCKCLTWYTLAVEFSMWTLIWFRKTRYIVLAASLVLHLGIDAALSVPVFEWFMIASLVNFVEPEDLSLLAGVAKNVLSTKFGRKSLAD